MKIQVRTAGLLGRHLPPGSEANRARLDLPEGLTVAEAMTWLGLPEGSYLVTLNGKALTAARRGEAVLKEGDDLALMPPLKGG